MEKTLSTLWEGTVLGAGVIVGAKWLDRNYFFSSNIAADPNFVNGMIYQHWGGIVAVAAAWGSTQVQNPYIKAGLVGLTVYGIIEEARQLFGWNTSTNPPTPNWGMMGPEDKAKQAQLDAQLRALAMKGPNLPMAGDLPMAGITDNYQSGVGSIPDAYQAGVGWAN